MICINVKDYSRSANYFISNVVGAKGTSISLQNYSYSDKSKLVTIYVRASNYIIKEINVNFK